MKKIAAFILTMLLLLGFAGCGEVTLPELTKLPVPAVNGVYNDVVSWASVPNATGYVVKIDDKEYDVSGLSYTISLSADKTVSVMVKAKGNGVLYTDSDWSNPVGYDYVKKETVSGAYKDTVINNGIGRAVNAIEDRFIEVTAAYQSPFKQNELYKKRLVSTPLRSQEASHYSESSMSELSFKVGTSFSTSVAGGAKYGIFSASLKSQFNLSASFAYGRKTNEIYYTLFQNITGNRLEIEAYRDVSQFTDILSDGFLADAEKLQNASMTEAAFIGKYGTHIVAAGYFGGRIQCYYYLATNDENFDVALRSSYTNEITGAIKGVCGGGTSTSLDIEASLGFKSAETTTSFSAEGVGGSYIAMGTQADFAQNYGTWASSFNNGSEYSILIDLPASSLISVWDMLPQEYASAKALLASYFDAKVDTEYNEFLQKYYYSIVDETENTVEFAGGHGTQASPYRIQTPAHLYNVRKYAHQPDAFFKLDSGDNLDLTGITFEPIVELKGTFDGGGYGITGFDYLTSASVSDRIGLFRTNSGTIKNLKLSDCTVAAYYFYGDLGGSTVFGNIYVGGLVGYNNGGTIENCSAENMLVKATAGNAIVESMGVPTTGFGLIVGGLTGFSKDGSIKRCYIQNSAISEIGTFAGLGSIYGYAGGIVGEANHAVTDCYSRNNALSVANKGAAIMLFTLSINSRSGGLLGSIAGEGGGKVERNIAYSNTVDATAGKSSFAIGAYNGTVNFYTDAGAVVGRSDSTSVTVTDCFFVSPPAKGVNWSAGTVNCTAVTLANLTSSVLNHAAFMANGWTTGTDGYPVFPTTLA
ncbi:MAG: MAC/perforin domain-containing protein [Firmicutes bacterium]|nr:MAC/perforin domain-containing protein [Bacillota bacterium]